MLTAKGAKIFGPRTGESAAVVGGEDGGLIVVLASDAATLAMLDTEDLDWWRGTDAGRFERKP